MVMKEYFFDTEIEIVFFPETDILTTSSPYTPGDDETPIDFIPRIPGI